MRRGVLGLVVLALGGGAARADPPLVVGLRPRDGALELPAGWCAEDQRLARALPARVEHARESWRLWPRRLVHCYALGFGPEAAPLLAAAAARPVDAGEVVVASERTLTACFVYPVGQRAMRMHRFVRAVPLLAPFGALEWALGVPREVAAARIAGDGPDGVLVFGRGRADLLAARGWLEAAGFSGDWRRGFTRMPATGAVTSVDAGDDDVRVVTVDAMMRP